MDRTRKPRKVVVDQVPSARELELQKQVETMAMQQAMLIQQLAAARPQQGVGGMPGMQLMVGLRNVSSYTIGVAAMFPGDSDLHLHPKVKGRQPSPNTVAVVSFAWWQQLRKSDHIKNGLIIRDDSVLGSYHSAGPADQPGDLAAGWEVNLVLDPDEWITSRTEAQIRRDIPKMTSEQSLRRLLAVVDEKVAENRQAIPETEADREERAVQDLPALYQLTERLAEQRLDALGPKDRV